jgi:branched-chain amino acid transport system permease protein
MDYAYHLLIYLSIYSILALSLNLVVGYGGMLTLAHATYFAVGGYAYAILTLTLGLTFLPAVAIAMCIAAFLSLAVSLLAWRLKGDFFVLASLAVQGVLFNVIRNWTAPDAPVGSMRNLTNGPFGIVGIPKPVIFGTKFDTTASIAILAILCAAVTAIICWRLGTAPWGRLLKCIRDDELAARSLGKNTRLAKLQTFSISCALAAVAGAIYVGYVTYIDPKSASLDESILMLSMVLIGGVGNFRGPIIGAAVLVAIPEVMRFLALPSATGANLRLLIYAVLLVVFTHLRPQGLAGEYRIR